MDSTWTKKRRHSRSSSSSSCSASHGKSKVKKSSRHRDKSSPSPTRKKKSLVKYHSDASRKEKRKKKKKKVDTSSSSSSSSESSSSSSSSSSSDESSKHLKHKSRHKKKSKLKKGKKKKVKKKHKNQLKKCMSKVKCQEVLSRTEESNPGPSLDLWRKQSLEDIGPVLTDEQKSRAQAMKPMTKEEWDARQSVIRKVLDPETGRMRLIKGDGEVLEEIVSKDRHKEINRQATANDGFSFQMKSGMF